MPRTPFAPNPDQQRALDQLTRIARRRAKLEEEADTALLAAEALGIPKNAIAEAHGTDWQTVARRLNRNATRQQSCDACGHTSHTPAKALQSRGCLTPECRCLRTTDATGTLMPLATA